MATLVVSETAHGNIYSNCTNYNGSDTVVGNEWPSASKSFTLEYVNTFLRLNGEATGNCWIEVWNANRTALIANGTSNTVALTSLSDSGAVQQFTWSVGSQPSIANATGYHFMLCSDTTGGGIWWEGGSGNISTFTSKWEMDYSAETWANEITDDSHYLEIYESDAGGSTVSASLGSLSLSGFNATVSSYETLNISVSGPTVGDGLWDLGAFIYPDSGGSSLVLSGFNVTVEQSASTLIPTILGSLTLSGFNPTVDAFLSTNLDPNSGNLSLTGFTVSVQTSSNVPATAGNLTISGLSAAVSAGNSLLPETVTLSLSGINPTVGAGLSFGTGLGSATLSGFNAAVSIGKGIEPSLGSMSLTGFDPAVSTALSTTTTLGEMALSGFNPVVFSPPATVGILPTFGQFGLSGFDVLVESASVIPSSLGQMSLVGFKATIQTTYELVVGTATVITLKSVIVT